MLCTSCEKVPCTTLLPTLLHHLALLSQLHATHHLSSQRHHALCPWEDHSLSAAPCPESLLTGAFKPLSQCCAAMGDSELDGTGIETSLNGRLRLTVHKAGPTMPQYLHNLSFPLLENENECVPSAPWVL